VFLLGLSCLVGVAAFNSGINLLYLLCATTLSALAVSLALPAWFLGRLRVSRHLPYEAFAGEPFEVRLHVRNPGGHRAFAVALRDTVRAEGRPLRYFAYLDRIPGHATATAGYRGRLPRRGVYPCQEVKATSRYPFGLARVSRVFRDAEEILILPRRVRFRHDFLAQVRRSTSLTGAAARRSVGDVEFRTLREFAPGDSPRRIHWRTTARMGKPYVRQMELERERTMLLLLDTHLPAADEARAAALEQAVCFCAEWARVAVAAGGMVRFACYAPDLALVGPMIEAKDVHEMLVALARLRPSQDRTIADLAAEPRVGFDAAFRRVAVLLGPDSEERLFRAVRGGVEAYVAGDRRFEDSFEPVSPEPVAGARP
jgi:uncharacterized protein (DUF58 family)